MENRKTSGRGLKICCGVTVIVALVMIIIITALALTVLKPKEPEITAQPTNIAEVIGSLKNGSLNVTLGMLVTIGNPNYGGFGFKNSTAYVYFQGDTVAEVPIEHDFVPARGKINITTSADLMVDKLISKAAFWEEILGGSLNLTSNAQLHGKVHVFKLLKFGATTISTCDITLLVNSMAAQTSCKSKIKL